LIESPPGDSRTLTKGMAIFAVQDGDTVTIGFGVFVFADIGFGDTVTVGVTDTAAIHGGAIQAKIDTDKTTNTK
jgi:hypothetical protein